MQSKKFATRLFASTVSGIALTMLMAAPAWAVLVQFNNMTATWENVQPPGVVNLDTPGNGTALAHLHWGEPFPVGSGGSQSGYEFAAAPQPIQTDVPVPGASGDVTLGTFTHENHPIVTGTPTSSITGVDLRLTMNVSIDGVDQGPRDFVFHFDHNETLNNANPCANGEPNGSGDNVNGCADHVIATDSGLSETFTVEGVTYTLSILGFRDPDTGAVHNDFWTIEDQLNPANLIARVEAVDGTSVPEPASLLLLGSALLGFGMLRRRRNRG